MQHLSAFAYMLKKKVYHQLPAWKEIKWRIKLKTQVMGVQGE